ncbi:hypothetical protein EZS27_027321 [termite gut metagenome]|uniref:Uncharacterized protein n=1 Tax=termite gut metagenome TaxID=433724 RepID=A0A5J4QMP6_9ZZZZ
MSSTLCWGGGVSTRKQLAEYLKKQGVDTAVDERVRVKSIGLPYKFDVANVLFELCFFRHNLIIRLQRHEFGTTKFSQSIGRWVLEKIWC